MQRSSCVSRWSKTSKNHELSKRRSIWLDFQEVYKRKVKSGKLDCYPSPSGKYEKFDPITSHCEV